MENENIVNATLRSEKGSSQVRKLRRTGKVPGVIYGKGDPISITLDHAILFKQLSMESFYSSVLSLKTEEATQTVLLREVQTHPVTDKLIHIDFQAIDQDVEISISVPVHYENYLVSPGVKLNHGIFSAIISELEIHCLPKDLPESITVDTAHLEINQSIHLSEIAAPKGVSFDALIRGDDPSIATVLAPQEEEKEVVEEEESEIVEGETPAVEPTESTTSE